ncbi:MAG: protein-(glutamine-N5) methyltransferase, release factor-specific [Gammaproteobacteria bacterium]|jgi:release factor glutamine methyltransferase|nr:protein-(glutamine-N5) methyltransferase, release factor-specific [Gammaproteobacteria bacterium]
MSTKGNTTAAPSFDEWRRSKKALTRLECDLLLGLVTNLSRTQIVINADQPLDCAQLQRLQTLEHMISQGTPMAYLLGKKEFFGLDFNVNPAVLVPRPETELLVELALERIITGDKLLDAGTGSGAIAVAIAHNQPDVGIDASDNSALALEVARGNAHKYGAQVTFHQSDWFAALQGRRWHLIVSNPPYIAADDPHLAELSAEPESALVAANRGLAALAHIIDQSPNFLYEKGWLLLEHGYDQAESVRRLMADRGFTGVKSVVDLGNIERVTLGQWYE